MVSREDGTYTKFEYGNDMIQTEIQSDRHKISAMIDGRIEFGPSLYDGNFIWTSKTET